MRLFLVIQSFITIASSVVLPFYILVLHEAGNSAFMFGSLYALFTLSASITYLGTDRLTNYFSYRVLLIISNLGAGLSLLLVPAIENLIHLSLIQIVLGSCFALQKNIEKILIAEKTTAETRVRDIGRYHAALGLVVAISILITGWLIDTFSLWLLFYLGGGLYLAGALMSVKMKL